MTNLISTMSLLSREFRDSMADSSVGMTESRSRWHS